jgi:hypothetical protein
MAFKENFQKIISKLLAMRKEAEKMNARLVLCAFKKPIIQLLNALSWSDPVPVDPVPLKASLRRDRSRDTSLHISQFVTRMAPE